MAIRVVQLVRLFLLFVGGVGVEGGGGLKILVLMKKKICNKGLVRGYTPLFSDVFSIFSAIYFL